MRRSFWTALFLSSLSVTSQAQIKSEHAQKTLDIYRTIVEVDTSKTKGNTVRVA
ncbi:MAG: carboxypeptidase PM20D1, partial [Congregibacter sp.]